MVKKLLMDIGVFTASGVLSIVLSFLVIKGMLPHPVSVPIAATATATGGGAHGETPKEEHATTGKDDSVVGPIENLEPIIVNLGKNGERRFMKITFAFELKDPKAVEELKKREPQIYDSLLKILGDYTQEQMSSVEGKEVLKDQITEQIGPMLGAGGLRQVYIRELIVQ